MKHGYLLGFQNHQGVISEVGSEPMHLLHLDYLVAFRNHHIVDGAYVKLS